MTHDTPFDGTVTTADEFEAVLGDLLAAATGNGIDLEVSWEYRSARAEADWELMVIQLEKRTEDG